MSTYVHRGEPGWAAAAASAFPNPEVPWDPDVVIAPRDVGEVVAAVRWAVRQGLPIALRAGGVGWKGARPGTALLDLRVLDGVEVDAVGRTVRIEGGAIWQDVHRRLAPSGLAAAGPQFPRLGVAGHVLGGGHGWLSCKLGWASDTLLAADVVTATGELVHVDGEHELLWALRGAGHEFGVVVALELALMPLERVSAGAVWFHPAMVEEVFTHYRGWVADAPDELSTIVSVAHPPPDLPVPPRLRGRPLPHVLLCHCGSPEQVQADLAGLRSLGGVVADTVAERPWPELAAGNDVFSGGIHRRSQMRYADWLSDAVIGVIAERCRDLPPLCFTGTHYYGGAMRRVGEDATAMSHRDQPWNVMASASWEPGEDGTARRAWLDGFLSDLAPHATPAFYVNYLFDEPAHVPGAYNPRTWARLLELKRAWDPGGRFAGHLTDHL